MKFKKINFIILMILTATAVSAYENTGVNLTLSYNRENNTTIVMVTHEPDFAKRSARNIHLVDGVIESDTKKKTR